MTDHAVLPKPAEPREVTPKAERLPTRESVVEHEHANREGTVS
jgi:hypothetical protein